MNKDIYAIYTTDAHLTERSFKSRTDDFLETMLQKLRNIGIYLADHPEVKYWFDGGDFFDSNTQNCRMINKIIEVFKEFPRQDIFPIISIAGNHVAKKNAEKFIQESGLMTLQEAGYFSIQSDPYIRSHDQRVVMMYHSDVVPDTVPWPHTTYKEISERTKADYFLVSHYHTPQDVQIVGNTMFIAPGSLSRGSGSEKNHRRVPCFAKFSLTGERHCEYVPVWSNENYPFIPKPLLVDIAKESKALVNDINELWEGIEKDSVDFRHVKEIFKTKGLFSPEVFRYAEEVYNKISCE